MKKWLRPIRGAIGMGVTWALGWAVAGLLIGVASILLPFLPWNAFFEVFDAPLPAFAIPGFFAGVFFSTVLGIAGRRHTFRDLSLPRVAAWGAAGGVLLTMFPFALVAVGLASREGSSISTGQILTVIGAPFVLLSALSASITLLVARRAERGGSAASYETAMDAGLTDSEIRELRGSESSALHEYRAPPPRERVRAEPSRDRSDS